MLTAPTLYGFTVTYHRDGKACTQQVLATSPESAIGVTRARWPDAQLPMTVADAAAPAGMEPGRE